MQISKSFVRYQIFFVWRYIMPLQKPHVFATGFEADSFILQN